MIFSKKTIDHSTIQPLSINGGIIEFVNQILYPGIHIVANPSLTFSHEEDLRSFLKAANSVLNQLRTSDELISMHLLYTHCVPYFSCTAARKEYSSRQMINCTTAINDAIRKIFTFHRWESVRALREGFGYKSFCDIFAKASNKFSSSLTSHHNCTVSRLYAYISIVQL